MQHADPLLCPIRSNESGDRSDTTVIPRRDRGIHPWSSNEKQFALPATDVDSVVWVSLGVHARRKATRCRLKHARSLRPSLCRLCFGVRIVSHGKD